MLLMEIQALRRTTETKVPFIGATPPCTLCGLPAHIGSCVRARATWADWDST